MLRSDFFQINDLEISFGGEKKGITVHDEVLVRQRIVEEVLGRSTFFLNPKEVEEAITNEFLTVREIKIVKKLPDNLEIFVSVRVPLARVRTKAGETFLIDAEGVLFRRASGEKLPLIDLRGSFEGTLGETIGGQEVETYLEALRVIEEKGLVTSSISLKPSLVELKLKDGPLVLLSIDDPVSEQIDLLIQLLKRYKIMGRTLRRVDLRFSRPVVRF